MNKTGWIIFSAVIVLIFGGLIAMNKANQASMPKSNGSNNVYGNVDSKVTLTEFVDFQCEACYAYYPTVKEVKEKYKDTVKFQVRHFPISNSHKFARIAASYAEGAAKQGKFWEMHDKIFEGQKQWQVEADPTPTFDGYAKEIGLDMAKLETDRTSDEVRAIIAADLKAVQELGGNGTPTFVLNGKRIEKVDNSVEAISKLIDDALRETGSSDTKN